MVRFLIALLFCVIVHGVFSGAQYILMERLYALPCSGFPVQSIGIFQNLQQAFSIAQYYVVLSLLRTMFFVILCIMIFSISLLFRNMILSISVILGASLLPVASRSIAHSLYLYSPVSVLYVNDLLIYQAGPGTALIVFGVYGVIAAALFASMLKWRV